MPLRINKVRAKKEYEMYANIKDTIKYTDGQVYNIKALDRYTAKILAPIFERKNILKEISDYYDGQPSKAKEDELQRRLDENNSYFMKLTNENKEKFTELFENAPDLYGKTPEWQNFHKVYIDLLGMNLNNQLNRYSLQAGKLKTAKEYFETKQDEIKKVPVWIQKRHPHVNIKTIISDYKREAKVLNEIKKELDDLNALDKEKKEAFDRLTIKRNEIDSDIQNTKTTLNTLQDDHKTLTKAIETYNNRKVQADTARKEYDDLLLTYGNETKALEELEEELNKPLDDLYVEYNALSQGFYSMNDKFNNDTLKELLDVKSIQSDILDYKNKIEELKNDPDFIDSIKWNYGKTDGWIQERYPWINELIEKFVSKENLKKYDAYVVLLDMYIVEGLDKWEKENNYKITSLEEALPEDISATYKATLEKLASLDKKEAEILNQNSEQISLQQEKIDDISKKIELAKNNYEKADNLTKSTFSPEFFKLNSSETLFSGEYATYPEQLDNVLQTLNNSISSEEKKLATLTQNYNEADNNRNKELPNIEAWHIEYDQKKKEIDGKLFQQNSKMFPLLPAYADMKPVYDDYQKLYGKMFSRTPKIEIVDSISSIQQQAEEWLKEEGLHADKHTNSKEFDRMINALKIVKNWPHHEDFIKNIPKDKVPQDFDQALSYLKEQAEKYKLAKDNQHRLFPSRLRVHRNTFVNFIIGFAEKSQDARTAQKEVEDLKHYFETKGKEYGTLTTENEKDNLMEENLIPNQKDIENYERDKEQFKEGKAPERTPIKEPELDDDEGMGLH